MRTGLLLLLPALTLGGWVDLSDHIPTDSNTVLTDVHFVGQEGWITATWAPRDTGVVFHTTDGGETFEAQQLPYGVESVHMQSHEVGYACGYQGRVYRTTNGGDTWPAIGSIGTTAASIDFPPGSDTGYCCGLNGNIWQVTPSGVTRMTSGVPDGLFSVSFPVSAAEGWVCGGSIILHFVNGEWTADQIRPLGGYNAIHMVDNSCGWVVGDPGSAIIHTTDGLNWTPQQIPDSVDPRLDDVFFLDASCGWAVGSHGRILSTTNGGEEWRIEADGLVDRPLIGVFAVDTNEVYVVGHGGTFLKYTGGPGIEERDEGGGMRDELRMPTVMRAAELARVEGRVFDMTGREVTDRKKRLAPGVYFVTPRGSRIQGFNGSRVRKVLVAR